MFKGQLYLEINLTNEIQDTENYKTSWEEIKDLNKWKDIPCSCIGGLNIVTMAILPELIYRFNAILIKMSAAFFAAVHGQTDSKIHMELQGTLNNQTNSEKEEPSWRTHGSWFQNLLQNYSN